MTGDTNNKEAGRKAESTLLLGEPGSPIAGMDRQAFGNFLTRALAGNDGVPSSILSRVNAALLEHGRQAKGDCQN